MLNFAVNFGFGETLLLFFAEFAWCFYSLKHVPGYIEKADELKSKGVDKILCLSGMSFTLMFCSANYNLQALRFIFVGLVFD